MAPIVTDPKAMPRNNSSLTPATVCGASADSASAILKNTRYVGALSNTLDSQPDAQKNLCAESTPNDPPRKCSISSAGCIATKIPMNSTPTSMIAR